MRPCLARRDEGELGLPAALREIAVLLQHPSRPCLEVGLEQFHALLRELAPWEQVVVGLLGRPELVPHQQLFSPVVVAPRVAAADVEDEAMPDLHGERAAPVAVDLLEPILLAAVQHRRLHRQLREPGGDRGVDG